MIQLNLPEQITLDLLIAMVSDQLGIRIIYDERLGKNQISIKSPVKIPRQSLLGVLESALKIKGLALLPDDQEGWFRIVEAQNLTHLALLPSKSPVDLSSARSTLAVTRVFTLHYSDPQRIEPLIKPFLTEPGGNSFILPDHRSLVITDFARNMQRIAELVELADRPGPTVNIEFVPVQHHAAGDLVAELRNITSARQRARGMADLFNPIELLEQPQTNQIVLIGSPQVIEETLELIRAIDMPLDLETRIYRFTGTTARKVDSLTRNLIGEFAAKRFYRSVVDEEGNFLLVTATTIIHAQIDTLKHDLDSQFQITQPVTRFHKLLNASAQEVLNTINQLSTPGSPGSGAPSPVPVGGYSDSLTPGKAFGDQPASSILPDTNSSDPPAQSETTNIHDRTGRGDFDVSETSPVSGGGGGGMGNVQMHDAHIVADVNTNTLIITAEPAVQSLYEELIRHLDQRRPQVLIEVTFVTLDTSDGFSFGVEVSRSDDGDNKVLTFSSFGLSEVDANTGALSLIPGLGFNGTIIRPDIADIVVRALSTSGRAQVTSAPRLLVNDNASGTLNSVTDAPTTSINASNTVSTTSFSGFESAGTTINVTPHISEGDHLKLEYSITLSAFTGEGSDGIPPPRQRNEMSSEVTIPDGYTVIVGGLTRTDTSETISKVPLLGDIPILEYLFSNRSVTSTQSTLFVFMRPIILRDDQFRDLKFLSERELAAAGLPAPYPASEPMLIY